MRSKAFIRVKVWHHGVKHLKATSASTTIHATEAKRKPTLRTQIQTLVVIIS